ncbi:Ppx/GppA phosphatase family protein [Tepidiforma thermophila]|uniref:Exopolyphosphatase/guanosine-5'-triphosphate, 3'-diphosphate pyrophosphatase n=1 Tax=Tepidiforma thermophila (strain KCTC 52669 / CGMCC 1.13589 / G233) TaxID=2761530 RepID=A0A2A9HIZ4_TEPT2|nr:Ppx/GppA phosphatase family protein [Tepidiforma thermophila]PFG75161.1 exopolyphosphatase/guanosine-5'-triphosphate,3'-diphosphate pyrophosphatase [Tepidiforma thermophila]
MPVHPHDIIAVIDVGSNSVRLLVARALSHTAFEVIDEARYSARLGAGQAGGNLTPEGIDRGLRALAIMTQLAESYAPARLLAVGTEALRRAPNADEFLERVRERTGVRIRVLSGFEEAHAGYIGVINSTTLTDGYLLDLGGGSLELMTIAGRQLREVQSVPLGAIYSRETYFHSDPPAPREIRALRKAVRRSFVPVAGAPPVLFGTGGAIRNLARIVRIRRRYPLGRLHGLELARKEVRRLARELSAVPTEARRRIPGVGSNRADLLHAAAIVIDEVMDILGADALTVSGQGLREGLAWQAIRGEAPILPDVRSASLAGLALANGVDVTSAEPTVSAAASLFDAARPLHGLGDADRQLLLDAARLAGIGMHIDYYNRDRHAEYLVHSGDLHGYSHREVVLLAALVRWADSGTPDLSPYRAIIQPDDTRRAAVLASLLGLARAIRRRSPSPIHDVHAVLEGTALRLQLRAAAPIDAELYELENRRRRFEAILRCRLLVEHVPGS